MNSLIVKVTAAVTVLAAAAAAGSYFSTPLTAGFLSSPTFLWVAANVIIIWLLSSSHRGRDNNNTSSAGHANVVLDAVDELYPSSDYEGFSSSMGSSGEAPVVSSKPIKRQLAREARAAATRIDRARVPKKKPAGDSEAAPTTMTESREAHRPDADGDKKKLRGGDDVPTTTTVVAAAEAEGRTRPRGEEEDDVSMDSLWQSMLQRKAVRPVAVRKSETWGNDELPRLQRAAETAARRREMRKSVSSAAPPTPEAAPPQASAVRQLGWRTRDVLVRAHDDLLRRAESLIRRHHEELRLQRQESEQRQAMERQRARPQGALIRV